MNKTIKCIYLAVLALGSTGLMAEEIMISWVSNGVLKATGMSPGTECSIEWTTSLDKPFTNAPISFDSLIVDSNGTVSVEVPLFFRARGIAPPSIPETMVLIEGGTNSGTDPDDQSSWGNYSLTVDSFYMDKTEVTKSLWDIVYNWAVAHGYQFTNPGSGKASDHPVHTVNWYDCVKWCNARSEMEGRTPCYTVSGSIYKTGLTSPVCDFNTNGFRLPTNDEWEYAARGGLNSQRFPWGNTISHNLANYNSVSGYSYDTSPTRGYHPLYDNDPKPYTSPAGSFSANDYGLYDMSGNVWEWCYTSSGSYRYMRGASWNDSTYYVRLSYDISYPPGNALNYLGFRSVISH